MTITFKFVINQQANFYFFVQNLSEWHFSSRKQYNNVWKKELGDFSNKELIAIRGFKNVRKRYPPSRSIFEQAFFTKREPWKFLKANLSQMELNVVKKIFDVFQKKFQEVYTNDKVSLGKWKRAFSKDMDETKNKATKGIIKLLSALYGIPRDGTKKEITIFLLLSTSGITGGGANINDKSITLEVSRYPFEKSLHIQGVMWHELIHLLFEKPHFSPLIESLNCNERLNIPLREIAATSLFPKGVLSRKFFGSNLATQNYFERYYARADEVSDKLYKIINEYILNNRRLDEAYIERVVKVLKNKMSEAR